MYGTMPCHHIVLAIYVLEKGRNDFGTFQTVILKQEVQKDAGQKEHTSESFPRLPSVQLGLGDGGALEPILQNLMVPEASESREDLMYPPQSHILL